MDEMLPFLRAIAAHPEDDTPRLVFADWLDEHGHHPRAEFIRLQIELARLDPGDEGYPEKTARMRRCGVFTAKGKHKFFDHFPTKKCRIGFRRGFIECMSTGDAAKIDPSGFDLMPLLAVRTTNKLIGQFKRFSQLKWLELRDVTAARALEILGPKGWFKNLEELSLPYLGAEHLAAGVVPQFDLPRLRNFFISSHSFFSLGVPVPGEPDEDDYSGARPWGGLPDYLPKNALPNAKTPLERFVWHSNDDCDYFNDEDWYWRGPTMDSLLGHLKNHNLKQIEVAVDYDDHENGAEGVIAAAYQKNPLELAPTLEYITLADGDLRLIEGATQKLKGLRVYGEYDFDNSLLALLNRPVCSDLESLHVEVRGGWWDGSEPVGPPIALPKLKALHLSGVPLGTFANGQFPNLVSLSGDRDPKSMLGRKWPKLQRLCLAADGDTMADLKAFAQSDCCPNLTTLTLEGYFRPEEADFSFLANCPHMPHLSLIQVPEYPIERSWVVADGELVPVRADLLLDDMTPDSMYHLRAVF